MTLIRTGGGVTDIRGSLGGVYFTRDKSGLHSCSKPRTVRQQSAAQKKQRDAFSKARTYTKDPRWVSYYIYRALNGLPFIFDAIVTGNPDPDCTGKYELAGVYNGKDYYEQTDSTRFIWWDSANQRWYITIALGSGRPSGWWRTPVIKGTYEPSFHVAGNPVVALSLTPPPVNYQIPKL